jgi:hypothetical protein
MNAASSASDAPSASESNPSAAPSSSAAAPVAVADVSLTMSDAGPSGAVAVSLSLQPPAASDTKSSPAPEPQPLATAAAAAASPLPSPSPAVVVAVTADEKYPLIAPSADQKLSTPTSPTNGSGSSELKASSLAATLRSLLKPPSNFVPPKSMQQSADVYLKSLADAKSQLTAEGTSSGERVQLIAALEQRVKATHFALQHAPAPDSRKPAADSGCGS